MHTQGRIRGCQTSFIHDFMAHASSWRLAEVD